jgi:smad nuclear-interacting protein 1
LAAETNTVAGVVLKYHEPPEARKPAARDQWRLFVFKGDTVVSTVELAERSCWLIGRERLVADYAVDHLSCSKQHAVIQFRHVVKTNEFGDKDARVRYIIYSSL